MRVPLRPRDLIAVVLVGACALAASGTHVVSSGETLSEIAARNGTTVRALVEANGISNPNLILVGDEIQVPDGAAGTGGSSGSSAHVVADGDTLGDIAYRYGVSVGAIADANAISNPNLVVVGTELVIPGGSSTPADAPEAASASTGTSDAAATTSLPGQRHEVQLGESIAGIAAKYGISAEDLASWNGLSDGKLYATTKLVLYDPGALPGSTATSTGPQTHTIQQGETLSDVATTYGSSSAAIAGASGIDDVNQVVVGQAVTIPAASSGGGSPRCPVPGASFFNDWGFPRSNGRAHAGIDLFAGAGTPIQAPVSGWVDIATGTVGGKQFRLTAPDGTLWFGSHMADFGVSGQVSAGDVIGYVGDSGNARGARPHLHFEVHPGGEAVNPYPLLASAC